jgi:hypothetical protein
MLAIIIHSLLIQLLFCVYSGSMREATCGSMMLAIIIHSLLIHLLFCVYSGSNA